jgi:hypothetical protein
VVQMRLETATLLCPLSKSPVMRLAQRTPRSGYVQDMLGVARCRATLRITAAQVAAHWWPQRMSAHTPPARASRSHNACTGGEARTACERSSASCSNIQLEQGGPCGHTRGVRLSHIQRHPEAARRHLLQRLSHVSSHTLTQPVQQRRVSAGPCEVRAVRDSVLGAVRLV